MPLVEWNSKINTGIEEIDFQHKKLVEIINKLHDAIKENLVKDELQNIFEDLIAYTKYHFATEEKIMEKSNYADLEKHKKQHRKFVEKLERLKLKSKNCTHEISIELSSFLSSWLIGHILHKDKEFSSSVKVVKENLVSEKVM